MGFAPRLERHSILHSRSIEETSAFLCSKDFAFSVRDRGPTLFEARINGVYLPGAYLGFIQYDWAVETCFGPGRTDYWVQFPFRGRIQATIARERFDCDHSQAVIVSPGRDTSICSEGEGARLNLSLTNCTLTRQLSALLNDSIDQPLIFAPALSLAEGHGRTLARYVRLLISEFERADSMLATPLAMAQVEEFLTTGLLLSHPHTYSNALRRLDRPMATRSMRRAIDYMEANAHLPITLADLVAVSGVAGRTLLKHFREYRGISPMRYMAKLRFQKARETLRGAGAETSVAAIAEACGFSHLSRFSVEYRKRFGESPSDTLRRSPFHSE